jgi:hypothetical protein
MVVAGIAFPACAIPILNHAFTNPTGQRRGKAGGKTLIKGAIVGLRMRAGVSFAEFTGGEVQTMSYASEMFSTAEGGRFNQIAMFSVAGLFMSMAMAIVGGFEVVYPWF